MKSFYSILRDIETHLHYERRLATLAIARNKYRLPVPHDALRSVDRTSSPAHVGKLRHAIDFLVPENTPVLAAADGIVTFVKDDSYSGGPTADYWFDSNFIVIKHLYGEYSRYDHLAHQSAQVYVGQRVYAGQLIARTGMTGYTFVSHLHFQVFVFTGSNIWTDFETLAIKRFEMVSEHQ